MVQKNLDSYTKGSHFSPEDGVPVDTALITLTMVRNVSTRCTAPLVMLTQPVIFQKAINNQPQAWKKRHMPPGFAHGETTGVESAHPCKRNS